MAAHANGTPLARIQIDCSGALQGQPPSSMFSGLPIGGSASKSSASAFALQQQQLALRTEAATGAERQSLLSGDDEERAGAGRRGATCAGRMQHWAPCFLYVACALTLVFAIVFVVLFYIQVNTAVKSIDSAVSLKSRTVNIIRNVDRILNKSADITELVNDLGGLSLSAAMFSRPYLTRVLNTTTNAMEDVHRLVERPVIQLHGRRK